MSTQYPNSPRITTDQIARIREQREHQDKLVDYLRGTAYYASRVAYDTSALSDRCRLTRLVIEADEILRRLVNAPEAR